MRRVLAAFAAALYLPLAHAQANPHAHHGSSPGAPQPSPAATPSPARTSGTGLYHSPFADYRAFKADEPMKDWRKANDEVRDAGGHIGLMKGEPAPPAREKK